MTGAVDGEWREEKHKRDEGGKFSTTGGGNGGDPAHAEAFERYKEFAGINDWLRGDHSQAKANSQTMIGLRDALDAAIAASRTDAAMTVYRGFGDVDVASLVGKSGKLRDKAFVSASKNEAIARDLAGVGYIAKIRVPAGARAYQYGGDDPQAEVLFGRNSVFAVEGVDHRAKVLALRIVK